VLFRIGSQTFFNISSGGLYHKLPPAPATTDDTSRVGLNCEVDDTTAAKISDLIVSQMFKLLNNKLL